MAAVLMLLAPGSLLAAERGETVVKQLGDDRFVAGATANLTETTAGDALVAGSDVTVNAPIQGDAVLVGRRVMLSAPIGGSLYGAGADVRVDRRVERSARLAGREVVITSQGQVGRGASVAASDFEMAGTIGSYLQVAAMRARIDGRVGGDVEVAGSELVVGPNAVIEGKLTFRGPKAPEVAGGAQVRGGVQHIPQERRERSHGSSIGASLLWILGCVILIALLLWRWPLAVEGLGTRTLAQPGMNLLLGFATLIGGPILLVVLAITVIGLPVALVLFLLWLLLLPLGYLAAAYGLAQRVPGAAMHPSRARRIGYFALVLVALALIGLIPVLGPLVKFVVLLLGLGALVQGLFGTSRPTPVAA